jgi:hypothetical protein
VPTATRHVNARPFPTSSSHVAWRVRSTCAGAALSLVAVLLAVPTGAQPRPIPRATAEAEPSVWLSGTVGLLQAESILDGRTNASWDFTNNAVQYRATLETAFSGGVTLGVQGSWAPAVPTTVRALGLAERPLLERCQPQCAASADLLGVAAMGRMGGGPGLHQVIELTAGVQQVRNLRLDGGGTLPPERDTDLHGAVAYGIGYSLSRRAALTLVQEFGIVSHQRDFLPRDRNGITQQRATRLTVRYGSGARR